MATERLSSHARRELILDTAVRMFSEKGFRGVTTRALAGAVGVSEPVLYQHFQTKRDLYRAIIEERAVRGERAIPASLCAAFDTREDDRQFLVRLANGIIDWQAGAPSYTRLLLYAALERHELGRIFAEHYSVSFFSSLADYFRRRMTEGAFRQLDPEIVAETFTAAAGHFGLNRVFFDQASMARPQAELVDGFVDIFLEGLKHRP
jgi:AcrR family transcriptional regulator